MESNNLENTTLGKYRVEAEIGRGGMAAVFRGYDPDLDRYVAVKVLAPHLTWDEMFVERFLREARAAARIKHPNIVTIHDVGQQAGWHYFVMEYLDGHSLTDLIQQRGPFPPQAVLGILRPVASALDFAHHNGLVHRDIKPGNIMVSPRGHVTLTDFGIARAAQETRLTGTGTIVGTPEYMSPEQAKGLSVDSRSDQYSLAVVAYELLSGDVPFKADSTLALMYKLVHEPPPPISETRTDLPSGVQPTLARALSKEPGARFATVTAFVDDLQRALAGADTDTAAAAAATAGAAASAAAKVGARASMPAPITPPPATPRPEPAAVPRTTPPPQTPQDRSRTAIVGLSLAALAVLAATIIALSLLVFGGDSGSATPTLAATKTTAQVILPGNDKETPTASPSPTPTRTRTSTPTRTPSRTPTRTPSRTPTRTSTPTATRTPTQRPPTATPLPPTATPLPPTATQPPPTQPPPTQPPPTQPPPTQPPPTQPPPPPPPPQPTKPPPQNTPAPP